MHWVTLFRLAFASAPHLLLNLAHCRNSPVHSTKGTPSPLNGLWLLASIRFQVLFHSAPAVLFTFPSLYWYTIGHQGVSSLAGWSPRIPARFHVPRRTQVPPRGPSRISHTGLSPAMAWLSSQFCYPADPLCWRSYNPGTMPVWASPLSLATTQGIAVAFLSSGY